MLFLHSSYFNSKYVIIDGMKKLYDICTIEPCNRKHRARGYCEKHYQQWRVKGSPYITTQDERKPVIQGDIAKVPIGLNAKDGYAIIDIADVPLIKNNLYLCKGYVAFWHDGKTKKLHRHILNLNDPSIQVDHINHNKLDNRRSNIRACSQFQNKQNSPAYKNSNFGIKGITKTTSNRWASQIRSAGKTYYLGVYNTPKEAGEAYNRKATELFGKFASTNKGVL